MRRVELAEIVADHPQAVFVGNDFDYSRIGGFHAYSIVDLGTSGSMAKVRWLSAWAVKDQNFEWTGDIEKHIGEPGFHALHALSRYSAHDPDAWFARCEQEVRARADADRMQRDASIVRRMEVETAAAAFERGVCDAHERRLILAALRDAGYRWETA